MAQREEAKKKKIDKIANERMNGKKIERNTGTIDIELETGLLFRPMNRTNQKRPKKKIETHTLKDTVTVRDKIAEANMADFMIKTET